MTDKMFDRKLGGSVRPYLSSMKPTAMMTVSTLTVQCSDFLKTFHRQYINAPIHRTHSSNAATINKPTMDV